MDARIDVTAHDGSFNTVGGTRRPQRTCRGRSEQRTAAPARPRPPASRLEPEARRVHVRSRTNLVRKRSYTERARACEPPHLEGHSLDEIARARRPAFTKSKRSPRAGVPPSQLGVSATGERRPDLRPRLVPRTRSSRTSCREFDRELRVQRGTRIIELLVVFDSEVRKRGCRTMMRTSESDH
jgi:hypothetical protein